MENASINCVTNEQQPKEAKQTHRQIQNYVLSAQTHAHIQTNKPLNLCAVSSIRIVLSFCYLLLYVSPFDSVFLIFISKEPLSTLACYHALSESLSLTRYSSFSLSIRYAYIWLLNLFAFLIGYFFYSVFIFLMNFCLHCNYTICEECCMNP